MKNFKLAILSLISLMVTTTATFAQEAGGIDETVNAIFSSATGWFVNLIFAPFPGTSFPWIVMWLVVGATVFTLYFGFHSISRHPALATFGKGGLFRPRRRW